MQSSMIVGELTQFFIYLNNVLHGDLGMSWQTTMPVTSDLAQRFPATLELVTLGLVLALPVMLALADSPAPMVAAIALMGVIAARMLLLVVDAAYAEFADTDDCVALLDATDNVHRRSESPCRSSRCRRATSSVHRQSLS